MREGVYNFQILHPFTNALLSMRVKPIAFKSGMSTEVHRSDAADL